MSQLPQLILELLYDVVVVSRAHELSFLLLYELGVGLL